MMDGDAATFTDDEIALIRTIRNAEIRVDPLGRLRIQFGLSDEYCAASLHKLLRAALVDASDIHGEPERNTDRKP